jgi:hypothetical protein
MTDRLVELAEIELPDFGTPTVEPTISADEYAARLSQVRERADARGLEFLLVYGDREHGANLTFLTGYDPPLRGVTARRWSCGRGSDSPRRQ